MSKPEITGITVSVEFGFEGDYGKGTKSFANIQGRYPDPATLEEVITDGLNMYFAAWESLLASRYATGVIPGPDFKVAIENGKIRLAKVRAFLAKENQATNDA